MPDLPTLALYDQCPDPDCLALIGYPHTTACVMAICVTTGVQRLLHTGLVDVHTCGEDRWTGRAHGAIEAAEYGLFVRLAGPEDHPLTGWIPCTADEPAAVPDLDRLIRTGVWNPDRQIWERLPEVDGCG
jgi:hypothetical protein